MANTPAQKNKALPAWLVEWWPILLGLIALYAPTYYELSTGLWLRDDQAHGPIVLVVVLYLLWQKRDYLLPIQTNKSAFHESQGDLLSSIGMLKGSKTCSIFGLFLMVLGLFSYILGHSQDILMLDIGSQIPVLAGILLLTRGMPTFRALWFPLFFIFFMIPLPGTFIDSVTLPMKMAVSYVAENVLFWFGYPISRTGVILQIGQYQLLVANACAGMHTLISLEALGLLYLNLVRHDSLFRNITLAMLIVPISFTSNVIRVMVLTLVTYYYGDAAGQGFVHGFAGMVLFIVALTLIMSVDSALQFFVKRRSGV
jgi:exosortase B